MRLLPRSWLVYSQPVRHMKYYTCINRMKASCGLPHLPVTYVEDVLAREVAELHIPADEVAVLHKQVADSLKHQQAVEQETKQRLNKELARLDVKEE